MSGAVALGLFGLACGGVVLLAVRRPLLARLALREALRRRGQSLLVVGGLMIGSAGITAALIGADSSKDSAVLNAFRAWGNVDLMVTSPVPFPPEVAARLAADPALAPLLDGVQAGLELVGSVADLDRRQGEPGVRLIGFDPATQGPFGAFVLGSGDRTTGADLRPGEVLVSRGLARELQARPGDRLAVTIDAAAGRRLEVRVAGVARAEGPGSYGLRPAVFAPLPTAQQIAGVEGINVVRLSASGGREEGVETGRRALPAVRAALARAAISPAAPLAVREVKAAEVDQAEESTAWTRAMLVGVSVLIVSAGAALVVNLVMMLAEERRPRLAVLRALGLTRRGLVSLSVLEGAIYSVVAAAAGTAVGLVAGRGIARRYAEAFALFFAGQTDFRFVYSTRPGSLALAFAGGALITLATVALAARRTARMTIAAAIRNLPEPARQDRRRSPPLLAGLLAAAGAAMLVQPDKAGRLAGGIAVIVGAALATRRRLPSRLHVTLAGGLVAGWSFFIVSGLDASGDPNKFFSAFTAAVLASVFGLSILAAVNLSAVERGVGTLAASPRVRSVLRPPVAYLARRPLRTGLSTGVFAVVLAIVTLLAVFLNMMKPRYQEDGAGFDIRVSVTGAAQVTLPPDIGRAVADEASVPTGGYVGSLVSPFLAGESVFVPLYELGSGMLDRPPVRLTGRFRSFGSDREVWQRVLADPAWVVANFATPGDRVTLRGPGGPVAFRVAANPQTGILDGVIASPEALAPFAAARGVTLLLDAAPGSDVPALARRIERELFEAGADATTVRSLLDDGYRANRTFFSVVEVLMRLGLVIGVGTLGILSLRAVVERRRVIGVLRAIGYRRREVMAGLMAEAWLTATIGVVVGFAAGAYLGYLFVKQFAAGRPYGMDGGSIAGALALLYGAVVLVTLGPAWRASRLPPAEAVRYGE